jgi:acetolactate synthase I/II/III large subunit
MSEKSGAQFIASFIKSNGITHLFYVEAILRRTLVELEKLGIQRILCHSEKAAAYMADGYARIAQKPGICMAQSVGAANLAAGLQDAFLGHSPVVAFTGSKPPLFQYRNAYQEINHNALFQFVTKYSAKVDLLEQLPFLLPQALKEATTGTPGPVHIDFLGYEGNLIDELIGDLPEISEIKHSHYPVHRSVVAEEDLIKAVQAIKRAQKPVLVVGRGAIVSGAKEEVRLLAEKLLIPVASSVDGKTILPDNHPLYVGSCGTYCRPCANEIISRSDLVFFIGTSTNDQLTQNWTLPSQQTTTIQLDINPVEVGRNYPNSIGMVGDAKVSLQHLLLKLEAQVGYKAWAEEAEHVVNSWRDLVEPLCLSNEIPIRPERLCRAIGEILPDNSILVADTGYTAIWSASLINLTSKNQTYIRAAGSLGWAFPASLGAKCAAPDRPVFCFTGDGAFWYHFNELETACRRGIKTITIVNNNSRLGQSVLGIRRAYRNDWGHKEHQYEFRNTNFARIAEEMGCFGVHVENPNHIQKAIKQAMNQDLPAVIDVVTEGESFPILNYDFDQ